MVARKYDWKKIESEYITGGPEVTFDSLIQKHGCAKSNLSRVATRDKWTKKRESYQESIRVEAEKISRKTEAKRRAKMLTIADSMKALGAEGLRRAIQDFTNDKDKRLDMDDLRLLIKDATEIERRALGMPDIALMTGKELDDRLLSLLQELDATSEG